MKINAIVFICLIACLSLLSTAPAIAATPIMEQQTLLAHIDKNDSILILDVRSSREYRSGHVPGAVHIPHQQLSSTLKEIMEFQHKPVVVYCKSGYRAGIAEEILVEAGFSQVFHLKGDMDAWSAAELPLE